MHWNLNMWRDIKIKVCPHLRLSHSSERYPDEILHPVLISYPQSLGQTLSSKVALLGPTEQAFTGTSSRVWRFCHSHDLKSTDCL